MAEIKLGGNPIHTNGQLPKSNNSAPNFNLVGTDLSTKSLSDYTGKKLILNIFPSIDTGVCAASVRSFNKLASNLENTKVLCISKDLPFAQKRFCGAEGIENVETLSDFRSGEFGNTYGLTITDGPLNGLHARAVVVLNENHQIVYSELVDDIHNEPNYDKALASL